MNLTLILFLAQRNEAKTLVNYCKSTADFIMVLPFLIKLVNLSRCRFECNISYKEFALVWKSEIEWLSLANIKASKEYSDLGPLATVFFL